VNLDELTVLDLFYVALISVGLVYFVVAAIQRAMDNHNAPRRRR
jgi:hypothetical protein